MVSGEDERAIDRAARSDEIRERWRITEEAKKEGGWGNLVPIRCPQCGDISQWPGHWSRPICALCHVQIDKRGPAYEERALRAMRSAVARAVQEGARWYGGGCASRGAAPNNYPMAGLWLML